MKVKISPGQELEIVTPGELRGILGEIFPSRKGPQEQRPEEALKLDASGSGTVELYTVPVGMRFRLHWLTVDADDYTPAVPFTNAAGYGEILRGGRMRDFVNFSSASGGIPAVWSSSVGIPYHESERVEFSIVGGPPSKVVVIRADGVLEPLTLS